MILLLVDTRPLIVVAVVETVLPRSWTLCERTVEGVVAEYLRCAASLHLHVCRHTQPLHHTSGFPSPAVVESDGPDYAFFEPPGH